MSNKTGYSSGTTDTPEPPENREQFTETVTNSIETNYQDGEKTSVVVTATWRRGSHINDDTDLRDERIDTETTVEAKYVLDDGVAELHSFYPDTTKTGERLKRENVKCLRALPWVYDVVRSHLDDNVEVIAPYVAIRNEMGTQ